MARSRIDRLVPLTGIAFVVLIVVGFGILGGSTPDGSDPAAKVVAYYDSHYDRQIAAAIVVLFSTLFFVVFGAAVRERVASGATPAGRLSSVVHSATTLLAGGFAVMAGIHIALADAAHHGHVAAASALNQLDSDIFPVIVMPLALFVGSLAVASLRFAVLPRWMGWSAAVLALAMLTPVGWFAMMISLLLIVAVSILLFREVAGPSTVIAAPPVAPAGGAVA